MKSLQKSLKLRIHSGINAFHSGTVDQCKCNSIDRSKECYFDTIYQGRYRGSHCLIAGWLKTLKPPYQTNKSTKNTKAGKNIRCHFQNLLMHMKINLVLIYVIFNISDSFLVFLHGIYKAVHSVIQIFMFKHPLQAGKIFAFGFSGYFEYTGKLLRSSCKSLSNAVYPKHTAKQSGQIDHSHNSEECKVINHRA